MTDYKKMYLFLFNRVTDALEQLEKGQLPAAKDTLIREQQECEEFYIGSVEENLVAAAPDKLFVDKLQ